MVLMAPVSWGELIDKITILELKLERIPDPVKTANVGQELAALLPLRDPARLAHPDLIGYEGELKTVNGKLWSIEDELRACERRQEFGPRFIELARAVYHDNDHRARVKRQINDLLGSELVEEKSYSPYGDDIQPT